MVVVSESLIVCGPIDVLEQLTNFRDDMLLFDDVSQHQHPILLPYDK